MRREEAVALPQHSCRPSSPSSPPPYLVRLHHQHPGIAAGRVHFGGHLGAVEVNVAPHALDHRGVKVVRVDASQVRDLKGG